jgi:ribokinase
MKADRPQILVIGSLNADLTIRTAVIPQAGESVFGESFRSGMGGKGACQAVAATRLGAKAVMAGKVGNDSYGEEMIAALRAEGTDTDNISKDDRESTGLAIIILEPSGQNRIISIAGANRLFSDQDLSRLRVVLSQSDMLVVQLEIEYSVVFRALEMASELGVPTILNPGPLPKVKLPASVLNKVNYLTPNESEAAALTGIPVRNNEDADKAAQKLIEMGAEHVIITLGDQGVVATTRLGSEFYPPFSVQAVDTVGAGDAFTGALAVELCRGATLREAITFASAAGALTATKAGAVSAIPYRSEVIRFMQSRNLSH